VKEREGPAKQHQHYIYEFNASFFIDSALHANEKPLVHFWIGFCFSRCFFSLLLLLVFGFWFLVSSFFAVPGESN
jgi:hypothetical protein